MIIQRRRRKSKNWKWKLKLNYWKVEEFIIVSCSVQSVLNGIINLYIFYILYKIINFICIKLITLFCNKYKLLLLIFFSILTDLKYFELSSFQRIATVSRPSAFENNWNFKFLGMWRDSKNLYIFNRFWRIYFFFGQYDFYGFYWTFKLGQIGPKSGYMALREKSSLFWIKCGKKGWSKGTRVLEVYETNIAV